MILLNGRSCLKNGFHGFCEFIGILLGMKITVWPSHNPLERNTKALQVSFIHKEVPLLSVNDVYRVYCMYQRPILLFTLTQRLLRLLAFGDIIIDGYYFFRGEFVHKIVPPAG